MFVKYHTLQLKKLVSCNYETEVSYLFWKQNTKFLHFVKDRRKLILVVGIISDDSRTISLKSSVSYGVNSRKLFFSREHGKHMTFPDQGWTGTGQYRYSRLSINTVRQYLIRGAAKTHQQLRERPSHSPFSPSSLHRRELYRFASHWIDLSHQYSMGRYGCRGLNQRAGYTRENCSDCTGRDAG